MERPLKEIVLPVSKHRAYIATKLKYDEKLDLDMILYEGMDLEGDSSDKDKAKDVKFRLNAATMLKLMRQKIMVLTKKIVLDSDVEGIGKAGQAVPMDDRMFKELEEDDGALLQTEIEKILAKEKKS